MKPFCPARAGVFFNTILFKNVVLKCCLSQSVGPKSPKIFPYGPRTKNCTPLAYANQAQHIYFLLFAVIYKRRCAKAKRRRVKQTSKNLAKVCFWYWSAGGDCKVRNAIGQAKLESKNLEFITSSVSKKSHIEKNICRSKTRHFGLILFWTSIFQFFVIYW